MTVQDTVVEIIAEMCSIDPSKILPESRFDNGLAMDELHVVEMAVNLEEEFGVKIPERDLESFETVGDIVGYIEQMRGTAEGPA